MLSNVSNFNSNFYAKTQLKNTSNEEIKNNNQYNRTFSQSVDSVSFKGSLQQKFVKGTSEKLSKSIMGGVLVGLGSLLGFGVAKTISQGSTNQLDKYRTKYPELMKFLDEATIWYGRDDERSREAYTDAAKETIVKVYEKDPEKAYALSKKIYDDSSASYSSELLNSIETNYKELEKYNKRRNLEEAYQKSNIVRKNPNLDNIAQRPEVSCDALKKYNDYCIDEESTLLLEKATDVAAKSYARRPPEAVIELANLCKQYPDAPSEILKFVYYYGINDTSIAVLDKYSNNWDKLSKLVGRVDFETILAMGDSAIYPEHASFAQKYKPEEVAMTEYIKKVILTENLFKELESTKPDSVEMKTLKELLYGGRRANDNMWTAQAKTDQEILKFINGITHDKANVYSRIIKDGKFKNISEIHNLFDLYEKYPDTEVTDEMINRYNDPARRAMNLY